MKKGEDIKQNPYIFVYSFSIYMRDINPDYSVVLAGGKVGWRLVEVSKRDENGDGKGLCLGQ